MPQSDNPRFFKDFSMRNRTSACALYSRLMAVPALAQAPPAPVGRHAARAAAGLGVQRPGLRACAAAP